MPKTVEQLIRDAYRNLCRGVDGKISMKTEPRPENARLKLKKALEAITAGKGLNDFVQMKDGEPDA